MPSRLFVPGARPGPFPVSTRRASVFDLARAFVPREEFARLSRAAKVARADRAGAVVYRAR